MSDRSPALPPFEVFEPPAPGVSARDWRDHVRVVRRRKWPALAAFAGVLIAAVVHAYTAVPVYEARARLMIEAELSELAGLRDPLEQDRRTNSNLQMQAMVLQSRSLARRALQAMAQTDDPLTRTPVTSAPDSAVPTSGDDTPGAEDAARIDGFLAGLHVTQPQPGGVIDLSYQSTDPAAAARSLNTLVEQYIEQNLELKFLASEELTDWLTARLTDQRAALEQSERALQDYREQNAGVVAGPQGAVVIEALTDLSEAYTRAKADRIAKEALLTEVEAARRAGTALESLPGVSSSPTVQAVSTELAMLRLQEAQLAEELGDRHPSLISAREATDAARERLSAVVARVVESVGAEHAAALATERRLGEALEKERAQSLALNRTDVELAVLERDAESNREIYQSLLQRVNEYGVTRGNRTSNIRVLDSAEVPLAPLSSGVQRTLRYGALGGLVFALGVAFLLEHLDNAVKVPDEIAELGLPFLGMVPLVRPGPQPAEPLVGHHPVPAFAEAIRSVRTNVRLSIAGQGMRSLVVTSPSAGEGKTLLSSNLASALALSGQRVLLIDADLRRPRIHDMFGVPQEPGLTNLLVGDLPASKLVHATKLPRLHVITSGANPPNPSELLDSQRFKDFLTHLEKHFDWVIFDAPPVMPVTDAVVLSDIVTGVLLVVAAESTLKPVLRTSLERLSRTSAIKVGAVLNKVDLERRRYYYARYYRPDYHNYYVQSA